jgi:hypothetical protein
MKTNIMGEDDREMRITLLEIMDKLPPETQTRLKHRSGERYIASMPYGSVRRS